MCRECGGEDADVVATATALTAESVMEAYRGFVWAHVRGGCSAGSKVEFCGGRRWGEECDVDGDVAEGVGAAWGAGAVDGGVGGSGAG